MRISTGQFFQQNTKSIIDNQSATNTILQQITSGKRVNTAGDDPVASIAIDNLSQKNTQVSQYIKNIDYAKNHLAIAEGKLGSADNLITSMRGLLIQGANGSLSAADRQIIADEMKAGMEELRSIANTQDESGNYMFSGFKTDSKPFAFDSAGNIVYSGDSGNRTANVAQNIQVGINVSGSETFMAAPNPLGDYGVSFLAGQQGDFQVESAKIVNSATHIADTYTFNFIPNAPGVDLQILNSAAAVVTTVANFDAANPLTNPVIFNGIEMKLSGTPVAGDSFTSQPKTEVSIFDSLNQAIKLLEDPIATNSPQGKSKLAQLLNDIDSGQNQVSIGRSTLGIALKNVESLSANHAEEQIVNSGALSLLEDLDFSAAITEYEKQKLALNAVSSVFSKVGSASLFDFI